MKVTLFITDRNGKKALWCQLGDNRPLNIGDLDPKEITRPVLDAIRRAVGRGLELERIARSQCPVAYVSRDDQWKTEQEMAR